MGKELTLDNPRKKPDEYRPEDGQQPLPYISAWYYADFAVGLATCVYTFFLAGMFAIYGRILAVGLVCTVAVVCLKKHYMKPFDGRFRKIFHGMLRSVIIINAVAAVGIFCILRSDSPLVYPVRRAIYCYNYSDRGERIFRFLPDKIPENAVECKVQMSPGFLQAEPYIQIEYFTDTAQLDIYREYAESCGAVMVTPTDRIMRYLTDKTGSSEVEAWKFPADGYTPYYYICPESGYFMITW